MKRKFWEKDVVHNDALLFSYKGYKVGNRIVNGKKPVSFYFLTLEGTNIEQRNGRLLFVETLTEVKSLIDMLSEEDEVEGLSTKKPKGKTK